MKNSLNQARDHFIQGMSRIANFWGFPKAMGAIYGAIYLSPAPASLDELVDQASVTKGAVSTNVRQLERLGMVHKHIVLGERKDYYSAETDFWKIVKGILREREKTEFDHALNTVSESLEMIEDEGGDLAGFYRERMGAMQTFFKALDSLVAAVMGFESLISLNALKSILDRSQKENS
jgi:DNA-binding transcriptional regulator GbsR (MarR family)